MSNKSEVIKNILKYLVLILCLFISAINFNLLMKPVNFVTGGTPGLSIVIEYFFGLPTNYFIYVETPPETKWGGTNIMIGDALCFVTGLNGDGTFRYVPNIIFEGTIEQWKALSYYKNVDGKEWLFGNAGNDVYVHCSDGTLLY